MTKPFFRCTELKKGFLGDGSERVPAVRSFLRFVDFENHLLSVLKDLEAFRHLRNLFEGSVKYLIFFRVYAIGMCMKHFAPCFSGMVLHSLSCSGVDHTVSGERVIMQGYRTFFPIFLLFIYFTERSLAF